MEPRILRVETGFVDGKPDGKIWADFLDYRVYANTPAWWRRIEQLLRADILMAWKTRVYEREFDLIWAGSEKVGLPLALMGLHKPLVVLPQHMASPTKRRLVKFFRLTTRWAAIGCLSSADEELFKSYYNFPPERIFHWLTADIKRFTPGGQSSNGSIISLGVAKRDYPTLIHALRMLPHYQTDLYITSRYGDKLEEDLQLDLEEWIQIREKVPSEQLPGIYQNARFVVLPLKDTTQYSAGASVALEAAASGKAVIATRTIGMHDYVLDGETGLLVPPGDVVALQEAIKTLWNDPELAIKMGKAGRKFMETHFNPEIVNRNIESFLINLVAQYS